MLRSQSVFVVKIDRSARPTAIATAAADIIDCQLPLYRRRQRAKGQL